MKHIVRNLPLYINTNEIEQISSFRHPDRYDEDVLDIINRDINLYFYKNSADEYSHSDNANTCSTHIISLVLVGDQNSGKSTFIHALSNVYDDRFLGLSSFVPILNGSFKNKRILFEDRNHEGSTTNSIRSLYYRCRDEGPYIDTDICRGIATLTADDFIFLNREFGIPVFEEGAIAHESELCISDSMNRCKEEMHSKGLVLRANTKYVTVYLTEFGGDHLDRLNDYVGFKCDNRDASAHHSEFTSKDVDLLLFNSQLKNTLERSINMLINSRNLVYFINFNTFFTAVTVLEANTLRYKLAPFVRFIIKYYGDIDNKQGIENKRQNTGCDCSDLLHHRYPYPTIAPPVIADNSSSLDIRGNYFKKVYILSPNAVYTFLMRLRTIANIYDKKFTKTDTNEFLANIAFVCSRIPACNHHHRHPGANNMLTCSECTPFDITLSMALTISLLHMNSPACLGVTFQKDATHDIIDSPSIPLPFPTVSAWSSQQNLHISWEPFVDEWGEEYISAYRCRDRYLQKHPMCVFSSWLLTHMIWGGSGKRGYLDPNSNRTGSTSSKTNDIDTDIHVDVECIEYVNKRLRLQTVLCTDLLEPVICKSDEVNPSHNDASDVSISYNINGDTNSSGETAGFQCNNLCLNVVAWVRLLLQFIQLECIEYITNYNSYYQYRDVPLFDGSNCEKPNYRNTDISSDGNVPTGHLAAVAFKFMNWYAITKNYHYDGYDNYFYDYLCEGVQSDKFFTRFFEQRVESNFQPTSKYANDENSDNKINIYDWKAISELHNYLDLDRFTEFIESVDDDAAMAYGGVVGAGSGADITGYTYSGTNEKEKIVILYDRNRDEKPPVNVVTESSINASSPRKRIHHTSEIDDWLWFYKPVNRDSWCADVLDIPGNTILYTFYNICRYMQYLYCGMLCFRYHYKTNDEIEITYPPINGSIYIRNTGSSSFAALKFVSLNRSVKSNYVGVRYPFSSICFTLMYNVLEHISATPLSPSFWHFPVADISNTERGTEQNKNTNELTIFRIAAMHLCGYVNRELCEIFAAFYSYCINNINSKADSEDYCNKEREDEKRKNGFSSISRRIVYKLLLTLEYLYDLQQLKRLHFLCIHLSIIQPSCCAFDIGRKADTSVDHTDSTFTCKDVVASYNVGCSFSKEYTCMSICMRERSLIDCSEKFPERKGNLKMCTGIIEILYDHKNNGSMRDSNIPVAFFMHCLRKCYGTKSADSEDAWSASNAAFCAKDESREGISVCRGTSLMAEILGLLNNKSITLTTTLLSSLPPSVSV